jgi:hypothetical protein
VLALELWKALVSEAAKKAYQDLKALIQHKLANKPKARRHWLKEGKRIRYAESECFTHAIVVRRVT